MSRSSPGLSWVLGSRLELILSRKGSVRDGGWAEAVAQCGVLA